MKSVSQKTTRRLLIADVIGIEQSKAYKDGTRAAFATDDSEFTPELNKEPSVKSSLKTACPAADALFGHHAERRRAVHGTWFYESASKQHQRIRPHP